MVDEWYEGWKELWFGSDEPDEIIIEESEE